MRIPREFTDELRNRADIVQVISDYVSLKKKGSHFWACCPFHHEKSASFGVHPSRQFFKCFGCGKAGDVFRFVMEIEGASFPEAIRTVAEKCGLAVPTAVNQADAREYEERDRKRVELRMVNQWATEFFEQQLNETQEGSRALEYLAKRGVSDETRAYFRLGYAPDSWDALGSYLRSRGVRRELIESSGLVSLRDNGSGSYDKFRGRLMFPICDTQGRIVAFGGRLLGDGEPKYLNSPETLLYVKGHHLFGLHHAREAIRQKGYAVLVEGYLDFLIPFQFGVRNLTASLGTALTETQVRLLGRYARRIVVNFDPDGAGISATKRSLETLISEGFKVNVLTLPDNLDPDEFIRARGPEGYLKLLKSSSPFLDYIVDQAMAAADPRDPRAKVETLNAILPYLRLVKDRIERAEQIERIADRLKIDSNLIRAEFKKAAETGSEKLAERVLLSTLSIKSAERRLLEIFFGYANLRRTLMANLAPEDYAGWRTGELFRIAFEFERARREFTFPALEQELNDEDLARELLPKLMMIEEVRDSEADEKRAEIEALQCLHTLQGEKLSERLNSIQMELNQAQRTGDTARTNELLMLKFDLAKKFKAMNNEK